MAEPAKLLRCAVYTRKSSDEGLEQEFNSLHAQREACEAYIASQKHEGWQLIPTAYDDGGFSGGSMNRPGLQQLLADIAAKLIDVVVVYKVDRLSRSLADFAKMVELFDAHGVSFVSVTQAFSTTTSMGRLTLNVLLSFAQFEREVTGERIRDKIAASKKKGMWMGGVTPLGYDVIDRKLVINEAEAEQVRTLFALYKKLGSADDVVAKAFELGIRSKLRTVGEETSGGVKILRGALYGLLANCIYIGEISHKGTRYPGQHDGIVPKPLFKQVQQLLVENRRRRTLAIGAGEVSLLAGLVIGPDGGRLGATHTRKSGRRYRYYAGAGLRIRAEHLETIVVATLQERFASFEQMAALLHADGAPSLALLKALERASAIAGRLGELAGSELRELLLEVIDTVNFQPDRVEIVLRAALLGKEIKVATPARLVRQKGIALLMREQPPCKPDPVLVRLVAQGRTWFDELRTGKMPTMAKLAKAHGVTVPYVRRLMKIAFLAPDLTMSILEGRQPEQLTAARLQALLPLPESWAAQRELFAALRHEQISDRNTNVAWTTLN